MSHIIERVSEALLIILGWFKNPELIPPIDDGVEVEEKDYLDEKQDFPETLSELLDHLETTFDDYKLSSFGSSWVSADNRAGLKNLGAHVPNPWQMLWSNDSDSIKVDTSKGMPTMIFISTPLTQPNESGNVYPGFMFAIKHQKLPWSVERKEGTPYQFGMAFRDKKLFWMYSWVVVKADGSFDICKEHQNRFVSIQKNGRNLGHYNKKVFEEAELIKEIGSEKYPGHLSMKNSFRGCFDWWINRQERWSVAVKKGGNRVTFSVDKSLTKKYFADRDKTVKTASGLNKKIIHYVKGHDRKYGDKITKVKEHIRGLNAFTWKEYSCLVTAPEFQTLPTSQFDIAPQEKEKWERGYVSASRVGKILAETEERRSLR
jgi:hypothetical protein